MIVRVQLYLEQHNNRYFYTAIKQITMKKTALLLGFILSSFLFISAQNLSDSIFVKKSLGTSFYHQGKKLTPNELSEITRSNANAYDEMKIARTNYGVANAFGAVGGALIGFPLGTSLGGGEPNWAIAGVGVGLVLVSVPFSVAYTKHAKYAINLYNSGLSQAYIRKVDFRVGLSCNGFGVRMTF